jgi:hypothetical protein
MTNGAPKWHKARWGLAVASVVVTVAICVINIGFAVVLHRATSSNSFSAALIVSNESTRAAYQAVLDDSKSVFEYGVVMLGALWGLVIVKEHAIKLDPPDFPEILMFFCANVLFLMFLLIHQTCVEVLVGGLLYAGRGGKAEYLPDLSGWEVTWPIVLQWISLGCFLAAGVAALFSAHVLKE